MVPAEQVENSARQQYYQMLDQAHAKKALAPKDHPQLIRLRDIAKRIIPHALSWNPRAKDWKWEVNLIGSGQINAFCMPGGKIAFYSGILDKLKLTDHEAAMVMGHEIAHALREHARERMGKTAVTNGVARIGREDETEADIVGLELAARAGFDPRAGVTLWEKMSVANANSPPQWLSTHPSGRSRIAEIEQQLPKVMPLYEKARLAYAE
ncbi:MAG: M48 family peptidase [Betaproteobacteria bacterium]|nr:M48 family peptidase [Betaproteobacteria bacterium]